MRQRRFEIIRTPDREGSSFLFNNVLVRYVGTCPETGISFYCNNGEGGVLGVRVYPDGKKVQAKVNETTYVNSKIAYTQNANRGTSILRTLSVAANKYLLPMLFGWLPDVPYLSE